MACGKIRSGSCIKIDAVAVRQVHIADDRFGSDIASSKASDSRAGIVERPARGDVMATALKVLANFRPEILVILDKKYPHSHPAGRQSDTTHQRKRARSEASRACASQELHMLKCEYLGAASGEAEGAEG